MKKNIYKSIISLFLALTLVFNTAFPAVVLAQELEGDVLLIETGDAAGVSSDQTDTNIDVTQVEGEGDVLVETEQDAVVIADSESDSVSGENNINGDGASSEIDTGDAASISLNDIFTNVSITEVSTDGSGSVEVDTNQTATVEADTGANSDSGENTVSSDEETSGEETSEITSGDSTSVSNSVNTTNVNVVDSQMLVVIESILGEMAGDINLYTLYESLVNALTLSQETTVVTDQTASVDVSTASQSTSGGNEIGGGGSISTGDATSIANTINLTNLNLVGNTGAFFVINIIGSLIGDIIIPNIQEGGNNTSNINVITTQEADVNTSSQADSNTGENQMAGNGGITTGNATSISNTTSYVNLVKIGSAWVWLIINNYGDWNGSFLNWDNPGSTQLPESGTTVYEKDVEQGGVGGGDLTVITNQNAVVDSQTAALSNSGRNTIGGGGNIVTGNAFSLANDFSLTNFVGVGGKFFFGVINILGSWLGDLNVAYPDLAVSVTDNADTVYPGSSQKYTVTVTNNGKAKAKGINVDFGASDLFSVGSADADRYIENLGSQEVYSYEVEGVVSETALANTQIETRVSANSSDTEESNENNVALDTTLITLPLPQETGGVDERTPDLRVSVRTNVNEYVYPGDTVIAKIRVANQSSFLAHGVGVEGILSNDHPMPAIPMGWDLGDLKPGENVQIEFSIGLIEELPGGTYHLSALARGSGESGNESDSGWATSDFYIMLRYVLDQISSEAEAKDAVLGASDIDDSGNSLIDNRKYLPYILATLGLTYFLLSLIRRKYLTDEK